MNMLWVLVHWRLIVPFRSYLYMKQQRLISIFKCVSTLMDRARNTRKILWLTKSRLGKEIQKMYEVFKVSHWLEKRKKGVSLDDYFELLFCISRYY